jgi:hypothetical protein
MAIHNGSLKAYGNEVAPMDTLRRVLGLRNTAAGQSPDETRHGGFTRRSATSLRTEMHWRFLSGTCPIAVFLEQWWGAQNVSSVTA